MIFKIECANGNGKRFNTEIEARNEDEALAIVRDKGFFTTKIEIKQPETINIKPVPTVRKSSKSSVDWVGGLSTMAVMILVFVGCLGLFNADTDTDPYMGNSQTVESSRWSEKNKTYSNLTEGEVIYADAALSGLDEDVQELGKFLINQEAGKNKY